MGKCCGNCSCGHNDKQVVDYMVQYKLNYSETKLSRDELEKKLLSIDAVDQFELAKEQLVIYFDDKLISPEEIKNILI
ncbi:MULTISPECIES: hypothetical protein [unclassified Halanaerobium]|uniref:hypothetical protein n=1 Tax=unclassified Halanaerobium TaxID=2641197 RepID=UPI000DF3E53F|nr:MULTISPECIES: hypothetical protein [unclassified Halanaerobium]RCW47784.1 hypothetical protein DFR78_11161 [Halanaerobium sp. MA284_MarDTE_T2]RCW81816.1 hypothetical protein DER71_12245 [Halanaerobium sp. DL-01]